MTNFLKYRPIAREDMPFFRKMYADQETIKQMYKSPDVDDETLYNYFQKPGNSEAFTVTFDEMPVGGFTIAKNDETIGTFGIVLDPKFRGRGWGVEVVGLIEEAAKKMGLLTLRVDVYADNSKMLRILEKTKYRPFIWLEKNLE